MLQGATRARVEGPRSSAAPGGASLAGASQNSKRRAVRHRPVFPSTCGKPTSPRCHSMTQCVVILCAHVTAACPMVVRPPWRKPWHAGGQPGVRVHSGRRPGRACLDGTRRSPSCARGCASHARRPSGWCCDALPAGFVASLAVVPRGRRSRVPMALATLVGSRAPPGRSLNRPPGAHAHLRAFGPATGSRPRRALGAARRAPAPGASSSSWARWNEQRDRDRARRRLKSRQASARGEQSAGGRPRQGAAHGARGRARPTMRRP